MQSRRLAASIKCFEQLSSAIGGRVMMLQSDDFQVAHMGPEGKNNPVPKVLNLLPGQSNSS